MMADTAIDMRARGWLVGAVRLRSSVMEVLQFALLCGLLAWLTLRGARSMGYQWQWHRVPQYFYKVVDGALILGPLVRGLFVTLKIAGWSLGLTVLIGMAIALLRLSNSFAGRVVSRCYLETIRNTPLLVQLYLFYFVVAPIAGVDRLWAGILCLACFEGSFASEIFRAGIQAVGRGQWEASESLGLARADTYRFVILPQALTIVLPPLTGQAVSLIKHSAIVSVIAIFDLTNQARDIIADTFMSFEIWFTVAAIYLALTISLSVLVSRLERRLRAHR